MIYQLTNSCKKETAGPVFFLLSVAHINTLCIFCVLLLFFWKRSALFVFLFRFSLFYASSMFFFLLIFYAIFVFSLFLHFMHFSSVFVFCLCFVFFFGIFLSQITTLNENPIKHHCETISPVAFQWPVLQLGYYELVSFWRVLYKRGPTQRKLQQTRRNLLLKLLLFFIIGFSLFFLGLSQGKNL